jgi:hypothetical protein
MNALVDTSITLTLNAFPTCCNIMTAAFTIRCQTSDIG